MEYGERKIRYAEARKKSDKRRKKEEWISDTTCGKISEIKEKNKKIFATKSPRIKATATYII